METALINKQRMELLTEALERLPEREKTIMSLYYKEELTLQEIGNIFGVTQSRVSQIISKVRTPPPGRARRRLTFGRIPPLQHGQRALR